MSEIKTQEAALLWRRARSAWVGREESERPLDALELAAYLDGNLETAQREALERRLLADPEALDLLIAACGVEAVAVSEAQIERAAAMVRDPARSGLWQRIWQGGDGQGLLALPWLRMAGVAAALVIFCLVGFEMGRMGAQDVVTVEQAVDTELAFGFEDVEGDLAL